MTLGSLGSSDGEIEEQLAVLDRIRRRISDLRLDLTGLHVVTEAATGAYACTAVIAAMAGAASVSAVGKDTRRYGSYEDAIAATTSLPGSQRSRSHHLQPDGRVGHAVGVRHSTNSGHLRPISGEMIARLPKTAVIGLMFEAWEFRAADLDLAACRKHGIRVAAVNERHADVGVFPFLGPLCIRLLSDAGVPLTDARVAALCDNPFAPFILQGLTFAQCSADLFDGVAAIPPGHGTCWSSPSIPESRRRWETASSPASPRSPAARGSRSSGATWTGKRRHDTGSPLSFRLSSRKRVTWVFCLAPSGPNRSSGCRRRAQAAEFVRRGGYPVAGAVAELL